jgi:hypothetical protein
MRNAVLLGSSGLLCIFAVACVAGSDANNDLLAGSGGGAEPTTTSGSGGSSSGTGNNGNEGGTSVSAGGSANGGSSNSGGSSNNGGSSNHAGSSNNGGSAGAGGGAAGGSGSAADAGIPPITREAGVPGQWENITPPAPEPWANSSAFYYGFQWIDGAKADAPGTLYVGLDHGADAYSGVWKTTNGGNTWAMTGTQGPKNELRSCPQPVVVDPTNSNILYVGSIKSGLGVFKSSDGGATWGSKSIIPAGDETDPYWLSIDPQNHQHLLLTFHSAGGNWASTGNAGVLESLDGGATFPNAVPAGGWTGAGQFAFFLGQKNDGTPDTAGSYWIVATQYSGIWRTEKAGAPGSWSQVGSFDMTHGMEQLYRAPNGTVYLGSVGKIYRSTDNGKTWADTGAQSTGDGYGGLVGDGTNVWSMLANTGGAAFGPYRWQKLPIDDVTSTPQSSHWQFLGTTTFKDGPNHMIFDPKNRVVYASLWGAGVWRMKLQ